MHGNGHQKRISTILLWRGIIVLLVTPAAVELSVWIGLLGWGQPMSMSVWRCGIISLAVTNRAASSDSAAESMTNLMIWAIASMAPLKRGKGSSSERYISRPAPGVGLIEETSICMSTQNHVACTIDNAVVGICCHVVEEMIDCEFSGKRGFGLA